MFGSKSNINNFFALETSTHKILRLLPSTRIPTRQNLGAWMRNHSIVNQERIRIREYHKFLSKLIPIQISKILSFVMVLHIKFYLKKSLINFILIILFDFVFQDICYPFYISNGLCNYIFYFLLVSRKFKNNLFFLYYAYDSFGNIGVDFLICIPLELINFPMIMRSTHAQFKQSQAACLRNGIRVWKILRVSLPSERLVSYMPLCQRMLLLLGLKVSQETRFPGESFEIDKKDWCNCPRGFEGALNYKAYDSKYFMK